MNDDRDRDQFEAFLKEKNPRAYRRYLKKKKEAQKKGTNPFREFRDYILSKKDAKKPEERIDKSVGLKFWMTAIEKRLISVEEEDVDFLRETLFAKNVKLDLLVDVLRDRKKVADIVCALNIEKLKHAKYDSVYMIVDKLVSGGSSNAPPPPRGAIMDAIPASMLKDNPHAYKLLKRYMIEDFHTEFEKDWEETKKKLRKKGEEEPDNKGMYEDVIEYFDELRALEIPGVVKESYNPKTKKMDHVESYQKEGALFIAKERRTLIADDMGLGKTMQAVLAKNLIDQHEARKTTSVAVVKKTTIMQWVSEINRWNTEQKSIYVVGSEGVSKWNHKKGKMVLVTSDKEKGITAILEGKPDFVLINYDMVFRSYNGCDVGEKLANVCDYLVLDEIQNAKNAEGYRGKTILEMSKQSKYVTMLSGTPVPNKISDLGVIAAILLNHEVTPQQFNKSFKHQPRVVRDKILPKMRRNTKRNAIGGSRCLEEVVKIEMSPEQKRFHERLDLNPDKMGSMKLLIEMRKCALDPRLVGLDGPSPKYEKLYEMLYDHYDGKPAVVFSSELKEGVLDTLCTELEELGLSVARIDGDPERSGKHRERILDEFEEGEYDVLVATGKTMAEGVDRLTVADRGYLLDPPYRDADKRQMIGRLDRRGQESDVVMFFTLVCENSLDERLLALIEQKKRLSEMLIDGQHLFDFEKKIIEGDPRELVHAGNDPLDKLYWFFGLITKLNTQEVIRVLSDKQNGETVAEFQWDQFEGSFFGNTMNLVRKMVNNMEKDSGRFEKILDVASGPCLLARSLERPVVSLDANKYALQLGKEKLGDMAGEGVCASFTDIPLTDSTHDLVVFSLGLLHSLPEERERIFREINRCMKEDGVLIITLPSGKERHDKICKFLPMLGFEVMENASGTARAKGKGKFECVVITAKKVGEPCAEILPVDLFDFKEERYGSGLWMSGSSRKIRRREYNDFEIDDVPVEKAVESVRVKEEEEAKTEKITEEKTPPAAEEKPAPVVQPEPEPESVVKEPEQEEEKVEFRDKREAIEYLKRAYGERLWNLTKVPEEELAAIGIEIVIEDRASKGIDVRLIGKEAKEMGEKYGEFVKSRRPPGGKDKGPKRRTR